MASSKCAEQLSRAQLVRSPTFESTITSLIRFSSARIFPENTPEDNLSRVQSPFELQINDGSPSSDDSLVQSPSPLEISRARKTPEPLVQISEFRAPSNAPFEPIELKAKPKKLHRYIVLNPRTIFSVSLLTFLSLAAVLIGFGVAISQRQNQLNSRCSSISYCPRNSSYTVLCNITSAKCECYDTDDQLMGCFDQRHYDQACYRSQECSNAENLQCNLSYYQCQCLSHYYYNGTVCVPLLTYGESCSIVDDHCDQALSLTCLAESNCSCDASITFWNGEYCETYRTVNSACDPFQSISGCSTTFLCDNITATCQCPSSAYFDGQVCLSYRSYLEPCYDSSSCLPNSQLFCSWGLCQCDDSFFYWSPTTLSCVYPKQINFNSPCNDQTNCESDFGLRCINGQCSCEANSYWTPGNYCDFQSEYNEQCSTAPCALNTGLNCSSSTLTCTCPTYYYWDNYVCQYQRTYGGFCLYDTWCRMDLGLRCRSFLCTCSLCTTCFWDGVRCRDCPTSWQILNSNGTVQPRVYCYLKVDSYVNWVDANTICSTAATSYFGNYSHLIYIDDIQEENDVSAFATNTYYDIFIGHTYRTGVNHWFYSNGTLAPTIQWCNGVSTTFSIPRCARLLTQQVCGTDINCTGWTSRYVCELD